ncbi:MAG: 2TM domain-containing protein, partial [Burkholderiales bacterium]
CVNAALTAVNGYMGAPWWAVWPLVLWGLLVVLHFLYHRATSVDDAWVDERALDLRSRSYDLGHIDDIRRHPSPGLSDERGGPPPGGR